MVHTRHILGYLKEILTSFHSVKFNLVGLKKKVEDQMCLDRQSEACDAPPQNSVATAILIEKIYRQLFTSDLTLDT